MLEKIRDMLYPLLDDKSIIIDENTVLLKDLGLDSFTLIELISDVEDEFEIAISDKKIKELVTIADVIKCIESLQNK